MILADIKDRERYYTLIPALRELFDFVLSHDFTDMPAGRVEVDGDRLFINVSETCLKPKEQQKLEVHRRYIDVQIPLSTSESVAWTPLSDLKTESEQPFNEQDDFALYDEMGQNYITVRPGQFYIMFPEDAHGPIIGEGPIKKLIGKILIQVSD